MPQGPNYGLQGGSQWVIDASGTQTVKAGGSIRVESGGALDLAAGASFTGGAGVAAFSNLTLGGTTAKWAFGTVGLASGVGTIGLPGFTRVLAASANPILGEAMGAGSAAFVHVDLSLSGAGSIIFRVGSVAGALWAANSTISWQAHGT